MKKILFLGVIMSFVNVEANEPKLPEIEKIKFKPPVVERIQTKSQTVIYHQLDKTLPVIHLSVMLKGGKVYDPKDKIGLGEMTVSLIREGGTKKYSSDEIDKTLEYLGANIEATINPEDIKITMTCLKKDFDKVFDIFFDMIKEPAFEEKKYQLKKEEMLELIRRRNDKPDRQATREALRRFYGPDHPYGWRAEIETINAITINDLKNYHQNYFKSSNMIIAFAGDFEKDMLKKVIDSFESLPAGKVNFPPIPQVIFPDSRKIYLIDKPLSQTFIVFLLPGIKRHDEKEFPLSVLSEYMGGGIQSKLGREIRSQRGLAYSVYSYFTKRTDRGFIMTYLGTKPESVYQAISEVIKQKNLVKTDNIPDEEFEMSKSQLINSFVFRFPTPFDLVEERASYELYGYKKDYLDTYVDKLDAVSKQEMQKTAKEFYDLDKALIFVIGNSSKFDKPLSEFGKVEILKED